MAPAPCALQDQQQWPEDSHSDTALEEALNKGNHNPSSALNSQIKQKRRLTLEGDQTAENCQSGEDIEKEQTEEQLDAFPTSGQPVLDTTLKDMLLSLRGALQQIEGVVGLIESGVGGVKCTPRYLRERVPVKREVLL